MQGTPLFKKDEYELVQVLGEKDRVIKGTENLS